MNLISFEYNGKSSADFNLVIGSINAMDDFPFAMSRDILRGSINRYRSTPNHMGTQWTDVLTFRLSMVKDPCKYTSNEEIYFSEDEINRINAWLTSPDYPVTLKMNSEEDELGRKFTQYEYDGLFSDVTPQVSSGECVGFDMTFTTNSPFAWNKPDAMVGFGVDASETLMKIEVDTAEIFRELYPVITIEPDNTDNLSRVDVTIRNYTDNGRSISLNITKTKTIIDCKRAMVYNEFGLVSFDDMGLNDVDYIYWPRLFNGTNYWYISGAAKVTVDWREPRKVGAW